MVRIIISINSQKTCYRYSFTMTSIAKFGESLDRVGNSLKLCLPHSRYLVSLEIEIYIILVVDM